MIGIVGLNGVNVPLPVAISQNKESVKDQKEEANFVLLKKRQKQSIVPALINVLLTVL